MSLRGKWFVSHNTLGSFFCNCESGVEMDANRNFVDTNECLDASEQFASEQLPTNNCQRTNASEQLP